jgi:hypothetical protein
MTHLTTNQNLTTLTITGFSKFCELLVERFHTSVEHYCEINYFTIFVSLIDRSREGAVGGEKVILVGIDAQKKLLNVAYQTQLIQKNTPNAETKTLEIAEASERFWNEFGNGFELSSPSTILDALNRYRAGEISSITGIIGGNVNSYLNAPNDRDVRFRELMSEILSLYFKPIRETRFLSLPLIQFGQFDGLVHIIYNPKHKTKDGITYRSALRHEVKFLIKTLSIQYETLLHSWAVKGLKNEGGKNIHNPLLKELGLDTYYQKSENYHQKRRELTKEHRKNAVTAIILDSYAHNIGAHSLPTITWWLLKRSEHFQQKRPIEEKSNFRDFPVIIEDKPFAFEMHHLLRFLNEKGEFWAGMSREKTFGGIISNLYDVFWYEFIQNLLVLGTIASTEGIYKLKINLTIYDKITKKHTDTRYGFERIKTIKEVTHNNNKKLLNGEFVHINLKELHAISTGNPSKEFISRFLTLNKALFGAFKKELSKYKVFFPGNNIGKHAFFTLIESEIRNVKHYPKAEIEKMQKEGLTLNISIEHTTCGRIDPPVKKNKDKALYKIGIWLNHGQAISPKKLEERLQRFGEDIIDEEFNPKFGGSYQDKICAAFLFNNSFISVQDMEISERHNMYYPWVKMGMSRFKEEKLEELHDYEVSHPRLTKEIESRQFYEKDAYDFLGINEDDGKSKEQKNGWGYYKKFIHLWKGKETIEIDPHVSNQIQNGWENPARFRFAVVPNKDKDNWNKMRQAGIIRIIIKKPKELDDAPKAFITWLGKWLKNPNQSCRIIFEEPTVTIGEQTASEFANSVLGYLDFKDNELNYISEAHKDFDPFAEVNCHKIRLIHNPDDEADVPNAIGDFGMNTQQSFCRYRRHGVFMTHFIRNTDAANFSLARATIKKDLAAEMFEVLATKICIFENRIYNRIKTTSANLFPILDQQLMVKICSEDEAEWEAVKAQKDSFFGYHFLVVHLSFIEKFNTKKLSVAEFIKTEILRGGTQPDNFIFAVTTGRGRTNWWRDLEEDTTTDYQKFTTFKPIEDLLEGIENATSHKDDFELKYRLVKALFGS